MKPTSIHTLLTPAALIATLAVPSYASAQYRLPELVSRGTADSLHVAALALMNAGRWGDAARLHQQSAELRVAADSSGYRCYWNAAHLFYYDKDLSGARSSMTKAAAQALARGDVMKAADAYADAAWLANEQHKRAEVWRLGRQAEVLAESPLLSRQQREAILGRFTHKQSGELAVRR